MLCVTVRTCVVETKARKCNMCSFRRYAHCLHMNKFVLVIVIIFICMWMNELMRPPHRIFDKQLGVYHICRFPTTWVLRFRIAVLPLMFCLCLVVLARPRTSRPKPKHCLTYHIQSDLFSTLCFCVCLFAIRALTLMPPLPLLPDRRIHENQREFISWIRARLCECVHVHASMCVCSWKWRGHIFRFG